MKKFKNVIVTIVILLVVVLGVYFLSNIGSKKYVEEIATSNYKNVTKEDAVVYVGSDPEKLNVLKEIAKDYDIKVYHLNNDKKDSLEVWDNGELTDEYDFSNFSLDKEKPVGIKEVDISEYQKHIKDSGYNFMYVGREGCHYCGLYDETLEEVMKEINLTVYYLDIAKLDEDGMKELYDTDIYFSTEQWGTPTTMLYKDGVRIDMLSGYVDSSSLLKFLKKNYVYGFLVSSEVINVEQ